MLISSGANPIEKIMKLWDIEFVLNSLALDEDNDNIIVSYKMKKQTRNILRQIPFIRIDPQKI